MKGGENLGLFDWFKKKPSQKEIRQTVNRAIVSGLSKGKLTGGKSTIVEDGSYPFWYQGIIKRSEFRNRDMIEKLKIIRDVNPDASMAIWNMLRLANSGHQLEAVRPNGNADNRATERLNELASRTGRIYGGGTDQLINVLLLMAITQGAIALEVELDEGLTDVVDFHAIDPYTLDYLRDKDTGELLLVQKQGNGEYKILNQEQVFYYPIDPDIGDPYGRSPILPVLNVVFFQAEVLRDLRKAIHHFGYDRFDISVVEEAIINNLPEHVKSDGPNEIARYVSSYVSDIQEQMAKLEPDDDFFHTDSVKIDTIGGSGSRSMDAKAVIDVINQQMVTALKQLPILLGRNEGTTETHGSIQWQIYVSGIQSIQRAIQRILERAYNVALQVYGTQLKASLEFESIRVNDRKAEAEAEEVETRVKIAQVNQGWITNDEASLEIVGHEAVDEPKQEVTATVQVKEKEPQQEESEESEQDSETDRTIRLFGQKKKRDLDFSVELNTEWAKDMEKQLKKSHRSLKKFLKKQRDLYIERLKKAPEIPTRILADVASLRSFDRDEQKDPTYEFQNWVKVNILYDSEKQEDEVREEILLQVREALELAAMIEMAEINPDIDFNMQDRRLMEWLELRSKRSAQLIQGVSDEGVLMTLWEVVYEGEFSIPRFSEALMDAYEFSETRANTIARTEVITAGRAGQYHADVQSGIVIGKRWQAALQPGRTRDSHLEADGQVVAIDAPFIVNGEKLMFPGDNSLGASAKNTIQCRCFYERILEGEDME